MTCLADLEESEQASENVMTSSEHGGSDEAANQGKWETKKNLLR